MQWAYVPTEVLSLNIPDAIKENISHSKRSAYLQADLNCRERIRVDSIRSDSTAKTIERVKTINNSISLEITPGKPETSERSL